MLPLPPRDGAQPSRSGLDGGGLDGGGLEGGGLEGGGLDGGGPYGGGRRGAGTDMAAAVDATLRPWGPPGRRIHRRS
ncbi:MAG TPA: hypothetical protein VKB14_02280, partial [Actinomycetales bacterium]|nr:hypothetical protein [Actinomycetales bacterium]